MDLVGGVANCHSHIDRNRLQGTFIDNIKIYENMHSQKMWSPRLSLSDVKKAVAKLRNRKAVVQDRTSAKHIIYGGPDLLIHISIVFQAMLKHGYIPE